jgi:hypothetical protein
MAMCFALRDYTSNMKVRMAVFQLKGSALLWWKTLLPQLNMAVEDVSWELFEERFRERYLSEEFIERQLNEFNALRQGGRTVRAKVRIRGTLSVMETALRHQRDICSSTLTLRRGLKAIQVRVGP